MLLQAAEAGKDLRSQGTTFEVNLKINVLGFKREKQDMLCQNLQLSLWLCVPDTRAHRKSEGNTLFVFSFEHWKWLNLN